MCYLKPGVGYANYTELILTGDKIYQNYILWNSVAIKSDLNKSINYNHLNQNRGLCDYFIVCSTHQGVY